MSNFNILKNIKNRYYCQKLECLSGFIEHHGDCNIFQSVEDYGWRACTCGLLHDLMPMESALISKIYPKYNDDCLKQGLKEDQKEVSPEILKKIDEIFSKIGIQIDQNIDPKLDSFHWNLIQLIFGYKFCNKMKEQYYPFEYYI